MAGQAGAVFVQNVTLDAVNVAHDIVMQHKSFQSDRMMTKKMLLGPMHRLCRAVLRCYHTGMRNGRRGDNMN